MMIVGNSISAAMSTLLVVVVLPLTKAAIWSFMKKKTKHVNKIKKTETCKSIFNTTGLVGIVNNTVWYFQTTKTCYNVHVFERKVYLLQCNFLSKLQRKNLWIDFYFYFKASTNSLTLIPILIGFWTKGSWNAHLARNAL